MSNFKLNVRKNYNNVNLAGYLTNGIQRFPEIKYL